MRRSTAPSRAPFMSKSSKAATDNDVGSKESGRPLTLFPSDFEPSPSEYEKNATVILEQKEHAIQKGIYSVLWGKYSARKHKRWEGDAVLIAKGKSVELKDLEGKTIGKGSGYPTETLETLEPGCTLLVGGKEVEIQDQISAEDFITGRCFTQTVSAPVQTSSSQKPAEILKRKIPSLSGSRTGSKQFSVPFRDPNGIPLAKLQKLSPDAPLYNPDSPNALVMPSPPAFHPLKHNKKDLPITQVVVDPHLSKHLRPHQKDGVKFLYRCLTGMNERGGMGAILADEMGLGKSLQTIALIWTLQKQGPYGRTPLVKRVLLVCPSSLVQNWAAEFRKWLGEERLKVFCLWKTGELKEYARTSSVNPVLIISYDMVIKCNSQELQELKFDLMVCDEGHRLKNATVKTNSTLSQLEIGRRVILTGTPVQNDLQELYALIDFVNPGFLGTPNQFKKVYENTIVRSHQSGVPEEEKKLGEARALELQRMTKEILLRRTAEINSKYLPPKAEYVLFCRPSEIQVKMYKKLIGSRLIERTLVTGMTPQHLTCIDALRKLCNHPVLLYLSAKKSSETTGDEDFGLCKELLPSFDENYDEDVSIGDSGKLVVLCDLLKSIRSVELPEKVVVVSNFTQTLDVIDSMCEFLRFPTLRLDGQTPRGQRQKIVKQFNSKHDQTFIFLLSCKAGGVGLNLIGASRIVLYDVDWNPANDMQAMARVWRDGQKAMCHIYRMLTTGTIEEKMFQRQVKKQGLSGAVVEDSTLLTADSMGKLRFSPEELKDIFTLHEDTSCQTHDSINCKCEGKGIAPSSDIPLKPVEQDERKCQLLATKKTKGNVSMAELLEWVHVGSEASEQKLTEIEGSCLPELGAVMSFLLYHYVD